MTGVGGWLVSTVSVAGLLVTLPAAKGPVLEAAFGEAGLFLARVGVVEDGSGIALA